MGEGGISQQEQARLAAFDAKLADQTAARPLTRKETVLQEVRNEVDKAAHDLLIKLLQVRDSKGSHAMVREIGSGREVNPKVRQFSYFRLPEALPDGRIVVAFIDSWQKGVTLDELEKLGKQEEAEIAKLPWYIKLRRNVGKKSSLSLPPVVTRSV